tara:strand:+ start:221 stop:598 length:378 start_codon:yes stop_codon:yes gene_type:complete
MSKICQKCKGNGFLRDGEVITLCECCCKKPKQKNQQPTRLSTLAIAGHLISKDRAEQYGSASKNFDDIARLWSAYLDQDLTKSDVSCLLSLLKIARLKRNANHEDSWIDLAGYAALGSEISDESE